MTTLSLFWEVTSVQEKHIEVKARLEKIPTPKTDWSKG